MAPSVWLMIWATPEFPLPAWVSAGHWTVEPLPSVQEDGAAVIRYWVKFCVVPEPSDRCATVMLVDGSVTPGLSAAMAGSFQVLMVLEKILAIVSADSCSLSTPFRLYETVIGPSSTGKYRIGSAGLSLSAKAASEPAKLTTFWARSVRPLPEPPPP